MFEQATVGFADGRRANPSVRGADLDPRATDGRSAARVRCGEASHPGCWRRHAVFPRHLRGYSIAHVDEGGATAMSRVHADPVAVQRRDDVPEQFLWRDRLYVVRDVLAHWIEAGAWWDSTAARALGAGDQGDRPSRLDVAPIPAAPKWGQRAWGEPAPDIGATAGP